MKIQFVVSVLVLFLAGCGGGGSSSGGSGGDIIDDNTPVAAFDDAHLGLINHEYAQTRSITGSGVTVAMIDDGVNADHEEFAGKMLNGDSGFYESALSFYTLDEQDEMGITGLGVFEPIFVESQADGTGHGTTVASMIWGENLGVAPGVDFLVLDVQEGASPDSGTAKGFIAELDRLGVDFANVSMTGVDSFEDSEFAENQPLFDPLNSGDIGWIVSAGNFSNDLTEFFNDPLACETVVPAARTEDQARKCARQLDPTNYTAVVEVPELADNFLYVGSIDISTLALSVYPNEVDTANGRIDGGSAFPGSDSRFQDRFLVAAGKSLSTAVTSSNTGYGTASGTSFAAPQVTGAAALVKSQFPTLTNESVLQVLLDTADDSFEGYDPSLHGQGILDIEAALQVDPADYDTLR